jgi:hypothetical protein
MLDPCAKDFGFQEGELPATAVVTKAETPIK